MLQDLISRATCVPPVPQGSRDAFEAVADSLGAEACRSLAALPELFPVRSADSWEVLADAMRDHPALMGSAFRLGHYELLARTFPWAYRVLACRGLPFDFWLFLFRYWRRAVGARLAPPLAAPVLAVYDWLLEEHPVLVRLSQEPESDPIQAGPPPDETGRTFLTLLLQGRSADCLTLAERLAGTPEGLAHFRLGVLQVALHRVGQLWEAGHISVADEHMATAIGHMLLARLAPPPAEPVRSLAVTACTPGERHELGCRMVADGLAEDGWQVFHLGADVPGPDLLRMLREKRPYLLALSVSAAGNLGRAHALVQDIRSQPDLGGIRILAGGPVLNGLPGGWNCLGADGTAADASGSVDLAAAWWRGEAEPRLEPGRPPAAAGP